MKKTLQNVDYLLFLFSVQNYSSLSCSNDTCLLDHKGDIIHINNLTFVGVEPPLNPRMRRAKVKIFIIHLFFHFLLTEIWWSKKKKTPAKTQYEGHPIKNETFSIAR